MTSFQVWTPPAAGNMQAICWGVPESCTGVLSVLCLRLSATIKLKMTRIIWWRTKGAKHQHEQPQSTSHIPYLCTWRRRWYLRTLCIGTTSRSLSVNFPLLALLEHSCNTKQYMHSCHFLWCYWDFPKGRVNQRQHKLNVHSLCPFTFYFRAYSCQKPWVLESCQKIKLSVA